jgi:hypothetical protein
MLRKKSRKYKNDPKPKGFQKVPRRVGRTTPAEALSGPVRADQRE